MFTCCDELLCTHACCWLFPYWQYKGVQINLEQNRVHYIKNNWINCWIISGQDSHLHIDVSLPVKRVPSLRNESQTCNNTALFIMKTVKPGGYQVIICLSQSQRSMDTDSWQESVLLTFIYRIPDFNTGGDLTSYKDWHLVLCFPTSNWIILTDYNQH